MDHLSELPDELIGSILSEMSFDERERLRKTSRRFYNLLQLKCVHVGVNFLNNFKVNPSERGATLCGHWDNVVKQFIGTVKIRYKDVTGTLFPEDFHSLEGRIKLMGETIIPVGIWNQKANLMFYLMNFDDSGLKHGIWEDFYQGELSRKEIYNHGVITYNIRNLGDYDEVTQYENGKRVQRDIFAKHSIVSEAYADENRVQIDGYYEEALVPMINGEVIEDEGVRYVNIYTAHAMTVTDPRIKEHFEVNSQGQKVYDVFVTRERLGHSDIIYVDTGSRQASYPSVDRTFWSNHLFERLLG